ncbi:MAG: methyltransferase domain-containing protein [Acidobacteria bacterium]|nr:methyltransferase domain-containing protein [Acidobacteriota bacterium]
MAFLRRLFAKERTELTVELRERIRRSFEEAAADEEHFPSTIDPRIQHVRVILETFGPLDGKRVLDAGCGKGRFGRAILAEQPGARIHGMDLALAMLHHVQPPLFAAAGSLTALPYKDGAFDCAYATESLEHAVDIDLGVAELCRVVKPGGRIVIIDKNKDHWGKLETSEWERWFGREEMTRMLARHCREVSSRPISYWEDVEPDGMFLVWIATR